MRGSESAGDDLLRWASETESASWDKLRDTAAFVAGAHGTGERPWRMASRMSDLGHIDIDWVNGRWSVAEPCLALPRGMGVCAFAAGWRTDSFLQRLSAIAEKRYIQVHRVGQKAAPTAIFVTSDSIGHLEHAAMRLNTRVIANPAVQLGELVSVGKLSRESLSDLPALDETLKYFDAKSVTWSSSSTRDREGLYKFDARGRSDFRLLRDGDWHKVDRSTGQLLVLQGRGDLIRWHRRSGDLKTPTALVLPLDLSLPAVAERALVASSGLLPVIQSGKRVYKNVWLQTATRLCGQIGLHLSKSKDPVRLNQR